MGITMDTSVSSLLTNTRRVGALKALGIATVGDALTYYPFRVSPPVPARALREARTGEAMAFAAVVRDSRVIPMNGRRGFRLVATVDDTAFAASRRIRGSSAELVFFSGRKSFIDWTAMRLRVGATVVIAGQPSEYNGRLQFTHPQIVTIAPQTDDAAGGESAIFIPATSSLRHDADDVRTGLQRVCRPRPVYHATSRISSDHIHETIVGFLRALADTDAPDGGRPSGDGAATGSGAVGAGSSGNTAGAAVSGDERSSHGVTAASAGFAAADDALLPHPIPSMAVIPDILPERVRAERGLMHRADAFAAIHDPDTTAQFDRAIATMRYEEAFICQTALLRARRDAQEHAADPCTDTALRDRFIGSLPFDLTAGQHAVIDDIAADMAADRPMQRLLQGEVGSGKTVVALAAMLQAVGSGRQAVLVAPTQVLAEQHHATICRMIAALGASAAGGDAKASVGTAAGTMTEADAGTHRADHATDQHTRDIPDIPDIPVILLTGGMKLAARRRALAQTASGTPCIVVATHAAFSKTFQAPNLALAVVDEQHRFGVEQRESLRAKGEHSPHLLVMTATPIPRTAAMTWFGDLDISWLTELPGGRKPIRTVVVPEADSSTMGRMFAHLRRRIDAGERAYIVCPRIDPDTDPDDADPRPAAAGDGTADGIGVYDESDAYAGLEAGVTDQPARPPLHAVGEIAARLQSLPQFAGIRFATLTGRDDDATKQQVMASFADGTTPVLVATTVIEVGVDVPQASCIVIFDADRYGLSQLHQLRGRVGRGGTASWAFLISRAESATPAEARLGVIQGTLDGAEIAQADLEFRGAGDVLGDAQSGGKSSLKLLRVVKDADLIADARTRAAALLADDPDLHGETQLAGAVLDFTRGNETFLTSN